MIKIYFVIYFYFISHIPFITQSTFDCENLSKMTSSNFGLTVSNYCLKCFDRPGFLKNIKLKIPEIFCDELDLMNSEIIRINPSDSLSGMIDKIPKSSKYCCFHSSVKEDQEIIDQLKDMTDMVPCSCKRTTKVWPKHLLNGIRDKTTIVDVPPQPVPAPEAPITPTGDCCICQNFNGIVRTTCGVIIAVTVGILTPALLV